jgi:hypothetical protein
MKGHCHCCGLFVKKNANVNYKTSKVFLAKKPATVTVAFLTMATFDDTTQTGLILFVLCHQS